MMVNALSTSALTIAEQTGFFLASSVRLPSNRPERERWRILFFQSQRLQRSSGQGPANRSPSQASELEEEVSTTIGCVFKAYT